MVRRIIHWTAMALGVFVSIGAAQAPKEGPTFREFSGFCQGTPDSPFFGDAASWDRQDLSWQSLEPMPGHWRQDVLEKFGQRVLDYRKHHANVLPILDFNAPWSSETDSRSYTFDHERYDFTNHNDGTWTKSVYQLNGKSPRVPTTQKTFTKPNKMWPIAPEHEQDWQNYVRRVVTFLRQPPYNVEYFQVWNEAHPRSSFWEGSLDDYMTRAHLPAARIIHELGGKVVYGGWPCCGRLKTLVDLLDRHDAWKTIDVIDIHYFPVSAFKYLRAAADQRGLTHLAIWQTEIAFTADPTFIGNTYPRFLDWCLANNWDYPDKYKLFFFCYQSPNDPKAYGYKHGLLLGKEPSDHGRSLQTLADLLDGGSLQRFTQITSQPVLKPEIDERLSGMEAFKVGDKRIVIAVHIAPNNDANIMTDWHGAGDCIHIAEGDPMLSLAINGDMASQISKAERVALSGERLEVPLTRKGTELHFEVPIRDAKTDAAAGWNAQGKQARSFYIVLTLNSVSGGTMAK